MNDANVAQKRVCLLTGAGGRLGSDFCARYRSSYDIVAVCRRRLPAVDDQDRTFFDPLGDVTSEGDPVFTVHADLVEQGAVQRVVDLALARFGRIDLIINAAVHVEHERLAAVAETTEGLDRAFCLNATVPALLAATVAREYWDGRRPENLVENRNVVNVSSGAGLGYVHVPGLAGYSASKAALNFLTCYLAEEFQGFGVRVNALAPTTFPELIATEVVTDSIVALDAGAANGTIVELT